MSLKIKRHCTTECDATVAVIIVMGHGMILLSESLPSFLLAFVFNCAEFMDVTDQTDFIHWILTFHTLLVKELL